MGCMHVRSPQGIATLVRRFEAGTVTKLVGQEPQRIHRGHWVGQEHLPSNRDKSMLKPSTWVPDFDAQMVFELLPKPIGNSSPRHCFPLWQHIVKELT